MSRPIAKPTRLAIIMSDGRIEEVDLESEDLDIATLDVDDRSDRLALCDALRAALVRVKAVSK